VTTGKKRKTRPRAHATETRRSLQELSDRLFNEGEHAEVACLRCPATFPTDVGLAAHFRTDH